MKILLLSLSFLCLGLTLSGQSWQERLKLNFHYQFSTNLSNWNFSSPLSTVGPIPVRFNKEKDMKDFGVSLNYALSPRQYIGLEYARTKRDLFAVDNNPPVNFSISYEYTGVRLLLDLDYNRFKFHSGYFLVKRELFNLGLQMRLSYSMPQKTIKYEPRDLWGYHVGAIMEAHLSPYLDLFARVETERSIQPIFAGEDSHFQLLSFGVGLGIHL